MGRTRNGEGSCERVVQRAGGRPIHGSGSGGGERTSCERKALTSGLAFATAPHSRTAIF